MKRYAVVYEKGAANWAAYVPDLPGCITTGATLEGCARALKSAGAARVDVAVIARVKESPGLTI